MTIRPLAPGDNAEWLRMRLVLWPDLNTDEHRVDMDAWRSRPDTVVLVAVRHDNTGLAGFAEVGARSIADGCETSPVAYLEGWFVDADVRRQGVGAALVRAAEAWARAEGYHEFASDVEIENVVSQWAHTALGFTEVDRVVVYCKRL